MQQLAVADEKKDRSISGNCYECEKCGWQYKILEAMQILDNETGEFLCHKCRKARLRNVIYQMSVDRYSSKFRAEIIVN